VGELLRRRKLLCVDDKPKQSKHQRQMTRRPGSSVTVTSSRVEQLDKQRQKQQRRQKQQSQKQRRQQEQQRRTAASDAFFDGDDEALSQHLQQQRELHKTEQRIEQIEQTQALREFSADKGATIRRIYGGSGAMPQSGHVPSKEAGKQKAKDGTCMFEEAFELELPEFAERSEDAEYLEVHLPPPPQSVSREAGRCLSVSDNLPAWAHKPFVDFGCTELNAMQSTVYSTAWKTNRNLLVCAPTGAGKTNVAMLSVLRAVSQNLQPGTNRVASADTFKMVYVAPMKALAQEVVAKFSKRLSSLGIVVRECTGDVQLSQAEMTGAHMLVTTPEKWDVVTRKGGENVDAVQLLIIDEVHLLAESRGAVIETIVARTQRLVETQQTVKRIVALSATLPNREHVAQFLGVTHEGLFHFGPEYRPVPLDMHFIGVKTSLKERQRSKDLKDDKAWHIARRSVCDEENQVMIFVHSRKETTRIAQDFVRRMREHGLEKAFSIGEGKHLPRFASLRKKIGRVKSTVLPALMESGVAIHHAGLHRQDRGAVEEAFAKGYVQVVVCTATLAWGVNLPAHTVIIHSTDVYLSDAHPAGWYDLSILDVQQIFGRAGRPQFDTSGEAYLLTQVQKVGHFVQQMTAALPLESSFLKQGHTLANHLNAELVLGTVTSIDDAVQWLSYTYLYVRLVANGRHYQVPPHEIVHDPLLLSFRRKLVVDAMHTLMKARMARLDTNSGAVHYTRLGRVAAHYYVDATTIFAWQETWDKIQQDQFRHMRMQRGDFDPMQQKQRKLAGIPEIEVDEHAWRDELIRADFADVLLMVAQASEFRQLTTREDELGELAELQQFCAFPLPKSVSLKDSNSLGKTFVLMQAHIARRRPRNFTLVSDMYYVAQNGTRLMRALLEIMLRDPSRRFVCCADKVLTLCQALEQQCFPHEHPLAQLVHNPQQQQNRGKSLSREVFSKIVRADLSVRDLLGDRTYEDARIEQAAQFTNKRAARDLMRYVTRGIGPNEIGRRMRMGGWGDEVLKFAKYLPFCRVHATAMPVTREIMQWRVLLRPDFNWRDGAHATPMWLFLRDGDTQQLLYFECVVLHRDRTMQMRRETVNALHDDDTIAYDEESLEAGAEVRKFFTAIPKDGLPASYEVSIVSDRYLGVKDSCYVDCSHIRLPHVDSAGTDTALLPLPPLPRTALKSSRLLEANIIKWDFLNPIQTQVFHPVYHGEDNILLCAPTGSGKTTIAELAIIRAVAKGMKAVYVAPLKALARERITDWREKFGRLGWNTTLLTGESTPSSERLRRSDVVVATPEKWDVVSRAWKCRDFVRQVALIVIDEVHLLGTERGAVLEAIISRVRYMERSLNRKTRLLALSTALANAGDLADWLGVDRQRHLFNFHPSLRPVPVEVHVSGYPGRAYCPRMALMNKPTYLAIKEHSPTKPTLVFVSSRRQTRLTAMDLIAYRQLNIDSGAPEWLHLSQADVAGVLQRIRDADLRHCIGHGVGMHHAGLSRSDRSIVEELFGAGLIKVLVSTATLAWGVNLPAHLVVVKGTEYFDPTVGGYVDYSVTDILQMMGRAGRPGMDDEAVACVMVHEPKKDFVRQFLYSPFPVESSLHKNEHLACHLLAEIASETITTRADALQYLSHSFLLRRVAANPAYYGVPGVSAHLATSHDNENAVEVTEEDEHAHVSAYLQQLIRDALDALTLAQCIRVTDNDIEATEYGQVAAKYYVSHRSVSLLKRALAPRQAQCTMPHLACTLVRTQEFAQTPVRHSEDGLNADLVRSEKQRFRIEFPPFLQPASPAHKTLLLIQSHLALNCDSEQRVTMPMRDYFSDRANVLAQVPRVLQACVDVAVCLGRSDAVHACIDLYQQCMQASWDMPHAMVRRLPHLLHAHDDDGRQRDPSQNYQSQQQRDKAPVICGLKDTHTEGTSVTACKAREERFRRFVQAAEQSIGKDVMGTMLKGSKSRQLEQLLRQHLLLNDAQVHDVTAVLQCLPRVSVRGKVTVNTADDLALSVNVSSKTARKPAEAKKAASAPIKQVLSNGGVWTPAWRMGAPLSFFLVVSVGNTLLQLRRLNLGRKPATVTVHVPQELRGQRVQVSVRPDAYMQLDRRTHVSLPVEPAETKPDAAASSTTRGD
ncbi:MAG: hypothetical protein MHM6MM_000599, partial [Cercozoa sp. M6MM]